MKNFIQSCFLALLCLIGSEIKSQVAWSPEADFPHRSDLLRGGVSRPDISFEGFSLVDKSISPEQEEFPSATPGDSLPVVIYLETRRREPLDSILIQLWNPYLSEKGLPLSAEEQLRLEPGSLYDGSRETYQAQWESIPIKGYGRISLKFSKFIYLDRFLVEPGDSVRIRMDFENARMLFSGPAAEKFRLQYELANAYENYRYNQNPTLFTTKSEYWGYSEEDSLTILKANAQHSSIRRKMEFISPGDKGLEHLKEVFSKDISSHPGFHILESYRENVDPKLLHILQADLMGQIGFDQMNKFSTYYQENEAHLDFFRSHIQTRDDSMPAEAQHSVHYPEYIYQKKAIVSALTKTPFRQLITELPGEISDLVYAKYIIKNYRQFKNSNRQFELALSSISTPWVHTIINRLYAAQQVGQPIADIPLLDQSGNEVLLSDFKGKLLFISFWLPGCQASSGAYEQLIKDAETHFKENSKVEFVYISHDRQVDRWKENIASGEYSNPVGINLNAPGPPHPLTDHYRIHAFPTFMVVDGRGTVQNIGNIPHSTKELIKYLESLQSKPSTKP